MSNKSVFKSEYRVFLKLLVGARMAAGLSQRQLAVILRRYQPYIARYETGERRLGMIEFLEIANALEIDPSTFVKKLTRGIERQKATSKTPKRGKKG